MTLVAIANTPPEFLKDLHALCARHGVAVRHDGVPIHLDETAEVLWVKVVGPLTRGCQPEDLGAISTTDLVRALRDRGHYKVRMMYVLEGLSPGEAAP